MNNIDEIEYINELIELYYPLLTPKQEEIMKDYYIYNLSLSEIANERKISRSAVLDTIEKSKIKLEDYEKKLGFHKKTTLISDILEKNGLNKKEINEIIEVIKYGI